MKKQKKREFFCCDFLQAKNQKGLSSVVTTMIIILLVLVAIGIVWVVIVNILEKGVEDISLAQFNLNLIIKKVKTEGNFEVTVKRNPGEGDLTGIKFVVESETDTDSIERKGINLQELGEQTFDLTSDLNMNIKNIMKVSIAPVYKTTAGKEKIGNIIDTYIVRTTTRNNGNGENGGGKISFLSPPTPNDGDTILTDSVSIDVLLHDVIETSFIDWDNSLIGWWRFNDGSDFIDHSSYKLSSSINSENVDYFVSNSGAWSWFGDPRALHYNGKTYIGFVDNQGDIEIWSYEHTTGQINRFTLHSALQIDDHSNPSILILDGKLVVFYSAHNGANMYYRISSNIEDISSWTSEKDVAKDESYSYPNPVYLSNENKVYLFYRQPGGDGWDPVYVTIDKDDLLNGDTDTWADPKKVFTDNGPQRPYTKLVSNGQDEIHFVFTNGHPTDLGIEYLNLYYFYYKAGNFYLPDGTFIKSVADLPVTIPEAGLVYDAQADVNNPSDKSWNYDIALDGNDNPVIVYATFPSTENHKYRYAKWNEITSSWENNDITNAGPGIGHAYYSGGIYLDHDNVNIVYLSKKVGGYFEIQKATTPDTGATWQFEDITSGSAQNNIRPFVIREHTGGFDVVWMCGNYLSYISYDTAICNNKNQGVVFKEVVNGKFGKAFELNDLSDEKEYIEIENQDVLQNLNELTIEAWVKWRNIGAGTDNEIIVSNWITSSNDRTYLFRWIKSSNKIDVILQNSDGYLVFSFLGINLFDEAWHHVATVYDGSKVKFYFDGEKSSTERSLTGTLKQGISPTYIGGTPHNNLDFFNGAIDEVKIWKRALSEDEIKASFDSKNNEPDREFTGLTNGDYTFQAHGQNFDGDVFSTELRAITIYI